MKLLALLLACTMCAHLVQSQTSQELRDHALKIHNDYRKNVRGACQMQRMVYDMELEAQAVRWANRCVFKHESVAGRGENLAWNSAKDEEKTLMDISSKAWYDEINIYSYGQYSCGSACHYTQMVWATTNKVGCATKRCPYLQGAYADAWYFVCFYLPGGNMNGEKPYPTQCKAPCLSGQSKDSEGLCVGGAAGGSDGGDSGGDGGDSGSEDNNGGEDTKAEVCEDSNARCPSWINRCTTNPGYMAKYCKKSCGICKPEGSTGNGNDNSNGNEEPCDDSTSRCSNWAKNGQCSANPNYMNKNCKKSCNQCGDANGGDGNDEAGNGNDNGNGEPCVDSTIRCATWAENNQCSMNPKYMLKNCKKSCKQCGGSTGTVDQGSKGTGCNGNTDTKTEEKPTASCPEDNRKCPYWKRKGMCTASIRYMTRNCPHACGLCN